MPAYLVQLPSPDEAPSRVLFNGADSAVVYAADEDDAVAVVKSHVTGDSNALWDAADITEIVAGSNWIGWTFHVTVTSPVGVLVADVSVTGSGAPSDSIDEIGALLATALNLTTIDHAAYASNTLTVTGTADNMGDHMVTVEVFNSTAPDPVPLPGVVGTITDEGSSGSATSVVFGADAYVVPKVTALVQSAQ